MNIITKRSSKRANKIHTLVEDKESFGLKESPISGISTSINISILENIHIQLCDYGLTIASLQETVILWKVGKTYYSKILYYLSNVFTIFNSKLGELLSEVLNKEVLYYSYK